MNKKNKDEFVGIVSDALNDVMIPALESLEERLTYKMGLVASKEDLKGLSMKVDSLNRKFDAQQDRQDKHNTRIEILEKIHPKDKHNFATS